MIARWCGISIALNSMAVYCILGDGFTDYLCFTDYVAALVAERFRLVPGWHDSLSCCLELDIATYMVFVVESFILCDAGVIRADLHLACTGGGSGRPQLCC